MDYTTARDYEFVIDEWILPSLGCSKLVQVTPTDVQTVMQLCVTTPLEGRKCPGGRTTANKIRRVMIRLFRAAAMRDSTDKNPAKAATRYKVKSRGMNPFKLDDLKAILASAELIVEEHPEYQPMKLLIGIQFVEHRQLMSEWGRPVGVNNWVFPDTRIGLEGNFDPFTQATLPYRFRKIVKHAGMAAKAYRFHDLRAAFAVNCFRAGMQLNEIQLLLGHESPIMTMLYAKHVSGEAARDSLRKATSELLPKSNRRA